MSSCSCLTFLPGPAWVLLSKICKDFFSAHLHKQQSPEQFLVRPRFQICSEASSVFIQVAWLHHEFVIVPPSILSSLQPPKLTTCDTSTCVQICQKSRGMGCVIRHCNLQCGITQPILQLFDISVCRFSSPSSKWGAMMNEEEEDWERAHHNHTVYGLNKQGHFRCEREQYVSDRM